MPTALDLPRLLQTQRKSQRLSLRAFSRTHGIPLMTLRAWELGAMPRADRFAAVARAYGISVAALTTAAGLGGVTQAQAARKLETRNCKKETD